MKKTIFITGSTDGIGKLAAIKLAKAGHEIYLHGRNAEKLEKVISEIKGVSNNGQINGFIADFANFDAVKKMADQVITTVPKLDVLINNAGVYKSPEMLTKDGLDFRFAVNYFTPYLLSNALLPLIKKSTTSRIINLSSAAQASVSLKALVGDQPLSTHDAYAQSKLALTMWSFHLAKMEPAVAVIAVNPGSLLNTKMVREGFGRIWSSADKGADILYDLAVSETYEGVSGKYFDNDSGDFARTISDAYDENAIAALLAKTKEVLS